MSNNLEESSNFDRFWQIYPKHTAKIDAQKAWRQMLATVEGLTAEIIIAGAERFASVRRDPKFTPHPATWLRRGSWSDEEGLKFTATTAPRQATEGSKDNERWQAWLQIRGSDVARKAASEGWAWNLRCKVLDGSIKTIADIDELEMLKDHERCVKNEDRVAIDWAGNSLALVLKGGEMRDLTQFRDKYFEGRRTLLFQEARTAEEIT